MGKWKVYFACKCSLFFTAKCLEMIPKPSVPKQASLSEWATMDNSAKRNSVENGRQFNIYAHIVAVLSEKACQHKSMSTTSNIKSHIKFKLLPEVRNIAQEKNYSKRENLVKSPKNHCISHINYQQSQCMMYAACNTIPWTNALDACGSLKTSGSMKI